MKILDCGAGGPLPPLSIFAEQGMMAHGIDASEAQVARAQEFARRSELPLSIQIGDKRKIPYEDASFDAVYEQYSMCHLTKADTAVAVSEMYRVLKPGGSALLGVVSQECWPLSSFGEERAPGERWIQEDGEERCHSLFTDAEADALVAAWEISMKEKAILYVGGDSLTQEAWQELRQEAPMDCSSEDWIQLFSPRAILCRYAHTYYILRKV